MVAVTMLKSHKDECGAVLVSPVHAMHSRAEAVVVSLMNNVYSCSYEAHTETVESIGVVR